MASDRKDRTYIAIDLKSYYASVECVERDLDPMKRCRNCLTISVNNPTDKSGGLQKP